jgi:hypothetical protein
MDEGEAVFAESVAALQHCGLTIYGVVRVEAYPALHFYRRLVSSLEIILEA